MNPNTPAITGALNYLYSVKVAFGANSEDYLNFLEVMKDFKAKRFVQSVLKIQYFFSYGNLLQLSFLFCDFIACAMFEFNFIGMSKQRMLDQFSSFIYV